MKRENRAPIDPELEEMNLGELLDLWDEPLEANQRQQLFLALEARGYRTRSLPEPPPEPARAPQIAPSKERSTEAVFPIGDPRIPMPPAYLWHVLLFFRPGIFFRTFGRQPNKALIITAV